MIGSDNAKVGNNYVYMRRNQILCIHFKEPKISHLTNSSAQSDLSLLPLVITTAFDRTEGDFQVSLILLVSLMLLGTAE